jgi:hypothetical protein
MRALHEVGAIVIVEFDIGEIRKFLNFLRALGLPPGVAVVVPATAPFPRGFFHGSPGEIDQCSEKWAPEIREIISEAYTRIDRARCRPATCLAFVSLGGHVVPGLFGLQLLKDRYPDAHFRVASVIPGEPVLREDFGQVLNIVDRLGAEGTIDTFLLSDNLLGRPDEQDFAMADGLAAPFTPFNDESQTGHNLLADMTPKERPGYVTLVIGARSVAIRHERQGWPIWQRIPTADHEDIARAAIELAHQTVELGEHRTLDAPLGVQGRSEPLQFCIPARPDEIGYVEDPFKSALEHDRFNLGQGADWFSRHREVQPLFAPYAVDSDASSALVTAVRFVAIQGGSSGVMAAIENSISSSVGHITEPARVASTARNGRKGK